METDGMEYDNSCTAAPSKVGHICSMNISWPITESRSGSLLTEIYSFLYPVFSSANKPLIIHFSLIKFPSHSCPLWCLSVLCFEMSWKDFFFNLFLYVHRLPRSLACREISRLLIKIPMVNGVWNEEDSSLRNSRCSSCFAGPTLHVLCASLSNPNRNPA